jgi:sugar-specific transcriptional regulator TrmB
MEELKELGLNDKEIAIYMILLKSGPKTIWEIASSINYKRTSIYDYIKSLLQKNIIVKKIEDKKTFYTAVEPNYLLELINSKREKIISAVKHLNSLKTIDKTSPSKFIYYLGVEGIKTIMNTILSEENSILLGYGSNKLSEEILRFYPENFAQKRLEKNIYLNAIIEPISKFSAFKNKKFAKLTKIKHNPLMALQKIVVFLTSKKTIILSMDKNEPAGIIIDNKAIYDSQKSLFNYLWKLSK